VVRQLLRVNPAARCGVTEALASLEEHRHAAAAAAEDHAWSTEEGEEDGEGDASGPTIEVNVGAPMSLVSLVEP
jgi:hypothetical protein